MGSWVAWLRLCTGSSGCPSGVLPSGAAAGPMLIERIIPPPSSKIRRVARDPRTFLHACTFEFSLFKFWGSLNPGFQVKNLSSSVAHSGTGDLFVANHGFHRYCYYFCII